MWAKRKFLMNEGDSVQSGIVVISRNISLSIELHCSLIGAQRSGYDIHQRALAGAVLANQSVHFAFAQIHADAVERNRGTEALMNVGNGYDSHWIFGLCTWRFVLVICRFHARYLR